MTLSSLWDGWRWWPRRDYSALLSAESTHDVEEARGRCALLVDRILNRPTLSKVMKFAPSLAPALLPVEPTDSYSSLSIRTSGSFMDVSVVSFVERRLRANHNGTLEDIDRLPKMVTCIDGRGSERIADREHVMGWSLIQSPGGTFGIIPMVVAYLENNTTPEGLPLLDGPIEQADVEKIFEILMVSVGGPEHVYGHTDEHDHKNHHPLCGCGHLKHSILRNHAEKYGLSPEAHALLRRMFESVPVKSLDILEGIHMEQGIFIIQGDDSPLYRMLSDPSHREQYFIVHAGGMKRFFGQLAPLLQRLFPSLMQLDIPVIVDGLTEVFMGHVTATAHNLAPHLTDKVYTVDISGGSATISHL